MGSILIFTGNTGLTLRSLQLSWFPFRKYRHACLHNVSHRTVYCISNLSARHRAGYTSRRKHFLQLFVCVCVYLCPCLDESGEDFIRKERQKGGDSHVWKPRRKAEWGDDQEKGQSEQESENKSRDWMKGRSREKTDRGRMCAEKVTKEVTGFFFSMTNRGQAPSDRKCDRANDELTDRPRHTSQTRHTDPIILCVCLCAAHWGVAWLSDFWRGSCLSPLHSVCYWGQLPPWDGTEANFYNLTCFCAK